MVKNPRTQAGVGTSHQPLNMPIPISVRTDRQHAPEAASLPRRGRKARAGATEMQGRSGGTDALVAVASVIDMWEVDDEWWRKHPVRRRYWQIKLDSGHDITVFQDLESGEWFHQEY